ncbi:unnamed protein product [Gongylonema pulchrum]|uniref:Uncharacterized protein n=1 Tax=Gongylonema pulchrum TaxID=637853 RepID=A0A183E1J1_9BILA|nr:unnamed protein product [Gongylonema pulchrum]
MELVGQLSDDMSETVVGIAVDAATAAASSSIACGLDCCCYSLTSQMYTTYSLIHAHPQSADEGASQVRS